MRIEELGYDYGSLQAFPEGRPWFRYLIAMTGSNALHRFAQDFEAHAAAAGAWGQEVWAWSLLWPDKLEVLWLVLGVPDELWAAAQEMLRAQGLKALPGFPTIFPGDIAFRSKTFPLRHPRAYQVPWGPVPWFHPYLGAVAGGDVWNPPEVRPLMAMIPMLDGDAADQVLGPGRGGGLGDLLGAGGGQPGGLPGVLANARRRAQARAAGRLG